MAVLTSLDDGGVEVAGHETPKKDALAGIAKIVGAHMKVKIGDAGPVNADPVYDAFDQSKFMNDENDGCVFVRSRACTYVAASKDSNNSRRFTTHRIPDKKCGLPGCNKVLVLGETS